MIKRRMKRLFKRLNAVPLPEKENIVDGRGTSSITERLKEHENSPLDRLRCYARYFFCRQVLSPFMPWLPK